MAEPTAPAGSSPPLAGVRVVEVAQGMAGPMAGMVLADYGADVIKIEPPAGDWARTLPGFLIWNRGKRSMAADLHHAQDVTSVSALLSEADVVITAVRDGSTAHGILSSLIHAQQDGLIHCDISTSGGYEIAGLPSDVPGYEHVLAAALGRMQGLDELSGAVPGVGDGRPVFTHAPVASYGAAQIAVQGVLGALWRRNRTGEGATVRTSLLQGLSAAVMRYPFRREEGSDAVLPRDTASSLQVKGIALSFLTAECADGRYIQMCARQDHHFRNWLTVLDLAHLLDDPRFARAPMGLESEQDVAELEQLLRDAMRRRTQAEWMHTFIHDVDVGGDPFLTESEFLQHPQLAANEWLVTIDDPYHGPLQQLAPIAHVSGVDLPTPEPAPKAPTRGAVPAWRPRGPGRKVSAVQPVAAGSLPFDGVTVVELAYYLAAPLGATLLAELGARVIKVEPPQGDSYRRAGVEFIHMVHGKESISLDLRHADAKRILQRLIGQADALLTNFRPGVPERLGFGYEQAQALNPQLIYLYASSYGPRGEQSHRAAFHSTPNALCGGGIRQAGEGNPPVDDSYPDPCSGLAVGTALALGLMSRDRVGTGGYLETSMLTSTGYALSNDLVGYPGGATPMPDGGQHGLGPLYRLYRCAQGWLFLGVCQEREWHSLAAALPLRDLQSRFGWPSAAESRTELEPLLTDLFRSEPASHWAAVLATAGVPVSTADGDSFETVLQRVGFLSPASHPSVGAYWRLAPRMTFDDRPPDRRPATGNGEFTQRILVELGYEANEIADLLERGVAHGQHHSS